VAPKKAGEQWRPFCLLARLRHDASGAPPARRFWRASGTTLLARLRHDAERVIRAR